MTNWEWLTSSKDELAKTLAVAEMGFNDWPLRVDEWRKWLDEQMSKPELCWEEQKDEKDE